MMPWLGRRWHRAAKRHCLVVEARARPAKMGSALKNKSRGIKPERRRRGAWPRVPCVRRTTKLEGEGVDARPSTVEPSVGRCPLAPGTGVRGASSVVRRLSNPRIFAPLARLSAAASRAREVRTRRTGTVAPARAPRTRGAGCRLTTLLTVLKWTDPPPRPTGCPPTRLREERFARSRSPFWTFTLAARLRRWRGRTGSH